MGGAYSKVADIVFGLRVDERTHQVIKGYKVGSNKVGSNKVIYYHKYKVIGTKSLSLEDSKVVDTNITMLHKKVRLVPDNLPNLSGTSFVAISQDKDNLVDCRYMLEFIRKNANSETSYTTYFDKSTSLPVYKRDGTLLTTVYVNTGDYEVSLDYGITMNYQILEYDWYSIHENREKGLESDKENYFSSRVSSFAKKNYSDLYEKVEDTISKFMDSYIIGSNHANSLILPTDCKYAHIKNISRIKELVLNKKLQYIDIDVSSSIHGTPIQLTVYISKCATKYLMGSFLSSIIAIKSFGEDERLNAFRRSLDTLERHLDYRKIWDICNKPENKSILEYILSDIDIVVY